MPVPTTMQKILFVTTMSNRLYSILLLVSYFFFIISTIDFVEIYYCPCMTYSVPSLHRRMVDDDLTYINWK